MRTIMLCLLCVSAVLPGLSGAALASQGAVEEYRKLSGLSEAEAKKNFELVVTAVKHELLAGRDVPIQSFGKFTIQERNARTARNPKTGQPVQVAARRYPHWVSFDGFKSEMNPRSENGAAQPVAESKPAERENTEMVVTEKKTPGHAKKRKVA